MIYRHTIADFAERTVANLQHIDRLNETEAQSGVPVTERGVFPATQLVNSLLGLVVFPKEGYDQHLEDVTLAALVDRGWPVLQVEYPAPACTKKGIHRECTNLKELVRVLRNGISHFNFTFQVDPHGCEISAVRIANRCLSCRQETTAVTLSLADLRSVALSYAESIISRAVEDEGYTRRSL